MEQYTVQKGDSLWKISRKFGIDINELANINGLLTKAEQHIIQPGQVLSLPSKDKVYDTQLTLRIYDLVWRPLRDAKLRVTFDGKTYDYVTDSTGVVAGLLIEDSTKGIKIELQHLNKKEYILIADHKKLPLGTLSLRISSREMIIKGSTSVKQGTQQSSKQQEKEKAKQKGSSTASSPSESKTKENQTPSVNQTTRTEGGAPTSVSNIGNVSEGLRLPPEAEQYRDYVIEAAKKYDFQPEGLAALIYAESRWKANATNSTGSGAVGLGQFKPETWLSLCAKPESKVYQFITEKYSYQKLIYKNKKLWGELGDGSITEIDKDTVLSLRANAAYNIDMIGLLDRQSIEQLVNDWNLQSIRALEPDEIVKVAYLVHMNGTLGAVDIIMNGREIFHNKYEEDNKPTELIYENRLQSNLKNADAEQRFYSIDGSFRTAFVAWMIGYFDSIIIPDHYRVEPGGKNFSTKDIIHKINPDYNPEINLPTVAAMNSQ
ncbi:TPA: LysM peptidoglycan-binding domain-containing protein, partial [Enterobacter bugandensis]|nr:LysM peptidoglycan-binding domain-containing protein [Enterobacter bugandensis]HCU0613393.1 LysM peptidoglycan-binding domain-containing protein [Enterobacter bugandensis]HDS2776377.1 LysM peptidoglycan-binding domain-containing protein [Enterobacter bugandensis]